MRENVARLFSWTQTWLRLASSTPSLLARASSTVASSAKLEPPPMAPLVDKASCSVCASKGCDGAMQSKPVTPVTLYMRTLPPSCIPFSSPAGRLLFSEALTAGHLASFFKLVEQFRTQEEPSFCGLASLAMVLNALAIDPRRPWKGPWRWFSEELLDCCEPLDKVRSDGIVLHKVACLARCNGAEVDEHNLDDPSTTLDSFRSHIRASCSTGNEHLLVSYSRRAFQQTGDGHFSPIGGYHEASDRVLVLDVAAFKYPPHWVQVEKLYEAMSYIDQATGVPRGYMRLRAKSIMESVLFSLSVQSEGWREGREFVRSGAEEAARQFVASGFTSDVAGGSGSSSTSSGMEEGKRIEYKTASPSLQAVVCNAIRSMVCALPRSGLDFVATRTAGHDNDEEQVVTTEQPPPPSPPPPPPHLHTDACGSSCGPDHVASTAASMTTCIPHAQRHQVVHELRALPLFSLVQRALSLSPPPPSSSSTSLASLEGPLLAERCTILLLLLSPTVWDVFPSGPLRDLLLDLTDLSRETRSLIRAEVAYLARQLGQVDGIVSGDGGG